MEEENQSHQLEEEKNVPAKFQEEEGEEIKVDVIENGEQKLASEKKSKKKSVLHPLYQLYETKIRPFIEHRVDKKKQRSILCYNIPEPSQVIHFILKIIFYALLLGAWFLALWWILGNDLMLPWGGVVFTLGFLSILAYIGGQSLTLIIPLFPPLLGMLLMGLLLRNVNPSNILKSIPSSLSGILRATALTIILLRAGLGLDIRKLKALGLATILLSCVPNVVEAITLSLISKFAFNLPWLWSFLLGFTGVAVSPAVVVPSLLSLQERGYGVKKGISTMVLAAAGFDDIFVISIFGVLLGLVFTSEDSNLVLTLFHGPIELAGGIIGGFLLGFVLLFLKFRYPWEQKERKESKKAVTRSADEEVDQNEEADQDEEQIQKELKEEYEINIQKMNPLHFGHLMRFLISFGFCMACLFGTRNVGFSGAGALASMVIGLVIKETWYPSQTVVLSYWMSKLWSIAQPILFGLIGSSVSFYDMNWSHVGIGVGIIVAGLLLRSLATLFCTLFARNLNWKERLFIVIAWLPKATVQAAIGPIPLDMAIERGRGEEDIGHATLILTMAVLCVLLTAPIGAILISTTGTTLLTCDFDEEKDHHDEDNDLDGGNVKKVKIGGEKVASDDQKDDEEMEEVQITQKNE